MSPARGWTRAARSALAAALAMSVGAMPLLAQRFPRAELGVAAGFAHQPDDNAGMLARTGVHLQAAVRLPVGVRSGLRATTLFEYFDTRAAPMPALCAPPGGECSYLPQRVPYALGIVSAGLVGWSEEAEGRLHGGVGAGMHYSFRSPWGGDRAGAAVHAILGYSLAENRRGLGIEASVYHLLGDRSGTPWLVPIGLTWTF